MCSVFPPEDSPSLDHSPTPLLHTPSSAIITASLLSPPSNEVIGSPANGKEDPKRSPSLPRTISFPVTSLPLQELDSKIGLSQCSQDPWDSRSSGPPMYHRPNQTVALETQTDGKNNMAEPKYDHKVEPPAMAPRTEPHVVPIAQTTHARRALFSNLPSRTPVRRTKSEGHVRVAAVSVGKGQSAVPEVCTDATTNDRLWSKLEPGSHRDSMSSSSSISSSDTVIDLSLPNLVRKSLTSLPMASGTSDCPWANCRRSALVSSDTVQVSKSKSNPNLRQGECPEDELQPRPLRAPKGATEDSPNRLTQRRHTWSRLYMEGLKQSSVNRPSSAATEASVVTSMSKSLGDLTSDDISCNFDSKYRSISRSFIVRPTRDLLRKGSPQKSRPPSDLTEQLRRLTDVEPLTASDFAPENRPRDCQEEAEDEPLMRRTSSRSQSRVRYVANRAKQAQERQRLQGMVQSRIASISRSGSISNGSSASPIEERGNPEGACCVAHSPCTGLDLLSQLSSSGSPSPRQSQSSPDPDNKEVFFMLKL